MTNVYCFYSQRVYKHLGGSSLLSNGHNSIVFTPTNCIHINDIPTGNGCNSFSHITFSHHKSHMAVMLWDCFGCFCYIFLRIRVWTCTVIMNCHLLSGSHDTIDPWLPVIPLSVVFLDSFFLECDRIALNLSQQSQDRLSWSNNWMLESPPHYVSIYLLKLLMGLYLWMGSRSLIWLMGLFQFLFNPTDLFLSNVVFKLAMKVDNIYL